MQTAILGRGGVTGARGRTVVAKAARIAPPSPVRDRMDEIALYGKKVGGACAEFGGDTYDVSAIRHKADLLLIFLSYTRTENTPFADTVNGRDVHGQTALCRRVQVQENGAMLLDVGDAILDERVRPGGHENKYFAQARQVVAGLVASGAVGGQE